MEYYKKIDGYKLKEKISEGAETEQRLSDIQITFSSEGIFFANSMKYQRVPKEKVKLVREKLEDLTNYNKQRAEGVATAISFLTLISEVEYIILSK